VGGRTEIGVASVAAARLDGRRQRLRFTPVTRQALTSSATGDETHFCPVPLPRKPPFRRLFVPDAAQRSSATAEVFLPYTIMRDGRFFETVRQIQAPP
jgi:hypothetical protein